MFTLNFFDEFFKNCSYLRDVLNYEKVKQLNEWGIILARITLIPYMNESYKLLFDYIVANSVANIDLPKIKITLDISNFSYFFFNFEIFLFISALFFLFFFKYLYNFLFLHAVKDYIKLISCYFIIIFFCLRYQFKAWALYFVFNYKFDNLFIFDLNLFFCRYFVIFFFLFFLYLTYYNNTLIEKLNRFFGEFIYIVFIFIFCFLTLYISNSFLLFFLITEIITFLIYTFILINIYVYERNFFLPIINYFFFSILVSFLFISTFFLFNLNYYFSTFMDLKVCYLFQMSLFDKFITFFGFFFFFFSIFGKLGLVPFHHFILDVYKSLNIYFYILISILPTYFFGNILFRIFYLYLESFYRMCSLYLLNERIIFFLFIFYFLLNFYVCIRLIFLTDNLQVLLGISGLFQINFLASFFQVLNKEIYTFSVAYLNWYYILIVFLLFFLYKYNNLIYVTQVNFIKIVNKYDFYCFNLIILFLIGFPPLLSWFFKFYMVFYMMSMGYLVYSFLLFIIMVIFTFLYVRIFFILNTNDSFLISKTVKLLNGFFTFFIFIFLLISLILSLYPLFFYDIFFLNLYPSFNII